MSDTKYFSNFPNRMFRREMTEIKFKINFNMGFLAVAGY